MNDLIERARQFATQAHERINQQRKYTQQPYTVHLKNVAEKVATVSDDPEMLAAAWLHDTVEDTLVTFEEVDRLFGPGVMRLVMDLTDISKPGDGNRAVRKAIDRRHTATACPRAKTIKLADLIDNCDDICRHDNRFGPVYLVEMTALLEVLREGNQELYDQAETTIKTCQEILNRSTPQPLTGSDLIDFGPTDAAIAPNRGMRLFTELFTARDILEPLVSFDEQTDLSEVAIVCQERSLPVIGVRKAGWVVGYLHPDDLQGANLAQQMRPIKSQQVLEMDCSLSDVIKVLTRFANCFVALSGSVVAVISRGDIDKPIVRMWLFGMITVLEMSIVDHIKARWPADEWTAVLSTQRLTRARLLFEERLRRNQGCQLLDCLQFSDKAQIAIEDPQLLADLDLPSKRAAKQAIKNLESLRNNLAHGQSIVKHDWPQIARLTQRVQLLMVQAGATDPSPAQPQ
ncbi:MAG: hypothetical protein BA870_05955 [Desulfuromonadales bacterium C00003094]|nr:MAG: hypothetical protein BA870_05955 [Desulfuromonadales bacterium C00003094]